MHSAFEAFHLHPEVLQGLASHGLVAPTPLQQEAIPLVLDGRDLVACAPAGAGSALAVLLPLLSLIDPDGRPQAIVLTSSAARAAAIAETALAVVPGPWRVAAVGAGRPRPEALSADLLVGTPAHLRALADRHGLALDAVRLLAVTEADALAEAGQLPAVEAILNQTPDREQVLVFAQAPDDEVDAFASRRLKAPVRYEASEGHEPAMHHVVRLPRERFKDGLLILLQREAPDRALLFTRSRWDGKRLAERIEKWTGLPAGALGGHLSAGARRALVERFQAGELRYLIVSDGVARGLNFGPPVPVIHLDVPPSDLYMERSAHAGPEGRVWVLTEPEAEAAVAALRQQVAFRDMRLELQPAPVQDAPEPKAVRSAPTPKPARPAPEPAPRPIKRPEAPKAAPQPVAPVVAPPVDRQPLAPPPAPRTSRRRGSSGPVNADTGRFLNDMTEPEVKPTTGPLVPLPRHLTSWRQFRIDLASGHRQSRDSFHGWLAQRTGIPRSSIRSIVINQDHATVEIEEKSADRFVAIFGQPGS